MPIPLQQERQERSELIKKLEEQSKKNEDVFPEHISLGAIFRGTFFVGKDWKPIDHDYLVLFLGGEKYLFKVVDKTKSNDSSHLHLFYELVKVYKSFIIYGV